MKITTTQLLAISGLLLSTQAHALTYTFSDLDDFSNRKVTSSTPLADTFNISVSDGSATVGYVPGAFTIVSAEAEFRIYDDESGLFSDGETVKIFLDGGLFYQDSSDFPFYNLSFTKNGQVAGTALINLKNTGSLGYSITSTSGDFFVDYAKLTVTANSVASVPDAGSTLMLLGSTLAGLAALRQKFAMRG